MNIFYKLAAGFLGLAFAGSPVVAKSFQLSLPLDCVAQESCFIQNYVDVDASKSVQDYTCRKSSYDGHKGTDFRIGSLTMMRRGVEVLAAAPGTIKAVRDGMDDRLVSGNAPASIKGRECGNGVVVVHGGGWETQYCHLRKGSLAVKRDDKVVRGQKLGFVGLSGKTAFPHIHLAVRHKGKVVDPFSGRMPSVGACQTGKGLPLFNASIIKSFPYRSGQVFRMGFAMQPVTKKALLERRTLQAPITIKAKALVFYAMALNLQKGDRLRFRLSGPGGVLADKTTEPMNRHKASYYGFIGKKRLGFVWKTGRYTGDFILQRGGKVIWQKTKILELK